MQQYNHARTYLEQTLEQEAEEKIANNRRSISEVEQKIELYNQAVVGINNYLQSMHLYNHLLPVIGDSDLMTASLNSEALNFNLEPIDASYSNGRGDAVEVEV